MKDIDTLEAQFRAQLRTALRRAANGRSPTIFSLSEDRARSAARSLRAKAERIMELRQSYSMDHSTTSAAARYLTACLRWEHGPKTEAHSVEREAQRLLRELDAHAT